MAAGNSAAKAGGAEIESSIFTNRFPIELFLAWESVEHDTKTYQ
jgi:hypothetical protein